MPAMSFAQWWKRLAGLCAVACVVLAPGHVWARDEAEGASSSNASVMPVPMMPVTARRVAELADRTSAVVPPLDPPALSLPPAPLQSRADAVVEWLPADNRALLRGAATAAKATSAVTTTVQVAAGNVRIAPDITSRIIGTVHGGDVLDVLGVSDGWYLVNLGASAAPASAITGEVGWVSETIIDAPNRSPVLAASPATAYRWMAASDARYIYDRNGVLHLRVTDEQAQSAVSADINGRASELAPARSISFTLTLHWAKGHAPGGSIFHAMLGDGRDFQMRVGPGEGYPWVDFAVDDQLLADSGTGFPLYTPTPVQFVWTGSEVVASVAGEERARVAVDKPLTSLRIAIEAEPGCVFHLTMDDMTVVAN